MTDKQQSSGQGPIDPSILRKKAEEQARSMEPIPLSTQTSEDIQRMLHELRVRQIELEMQNEELRRNQAELDDSRARYLDLYEHAPVGYCTLSEQGVIQEANLTAATLLGTTRSELVTQSLARFIYNDDQDIYDLHRKQLLETGTLQKCDLRLVKPNGGYIWAHLKATVDQAEDGAPVCRVVLTDISDYKRENEALRESKERFRKLVTSANSVILHMDSEGRITFFNEFAQRLFGYTAEEVLGRSVMETIVPKTDITGVDLHNMIRNIVRRPDTYAQNENENMRRDGSRVWISWTNTPIFNDDGDVCEILCIGNDITERKRAEKENRRFRTIADNAVYGKAIADLQGHLLYVNRFFANIHGYNPEELTGRHYSVLHTQEQMAAAERLVASMIRDGHFTPTTVWHCHQDGTEFPMLMSGILIKDEYGNPQCIATSAIDVSAQYQAEIKLKKSEGILTDIVESTLSGFWDWNLVDNTEYLSPTFKRMFGYEDHEMESSPEAWQKIIFPEDLPGVLEVFDRHVESRGREPFYNEIRYRHRDGSTVWVICAGRVIEWAEDGAAIRMVGCHIDITGRKRAEESLREREEKYRLIFNMGVNAMFLVDNDTTQILECNNKVSQLFGYSPEKLLTMKMTDLSTTPEATRQACREPVSKLDRVYQKKDGRLLSVEVTSQHFYLANRAVHIAAITDITESKWAEAQLLERTNLLENITNHMFDLVSIADLAGVFTYAGPSHRILGFEPDQLVGTSVFDYIHPDDTAYISAEFTEFVSYPAPDRTRTVEFRQRCKDGSYLWLETKGKILFDDNGSPSSLFFSSRNVTERKMAEEALREREQTHRALIDGLPDTVMRFNREGRHLFVSDNVREVVDIEAAQFIGRTHAEMGFPENLCHFWEESIQQVFDSGMPLETEFTFEGKAGTTTSNWRLIPERDAQGAVSSLLSISRDITAQRQAEQEYQTLFREMLDGFALHEIVCDAEGEPVDYRFLAVNPAFERMTGLKAETIIGRTVLEVMPGTEKHWIETFGKVALSGEPVLFENYASELDKHFEVRTFRPFAGQFACIFQDITEHKKAEVALRASEKLLSQTQEIAHIGSWNLDLTTNRLTWSDEVYRIFGYQPQDFPSTYEAFLDAIHPDDRAEVNEAYSRSTREGGDGYEIEHRILRGDSGEVRYVHERCVHQRDDTGTIIQSIGMIQDITERKQEQEENDRLQEQLIQAQMIAHLGSWDYDADENRLVWSDETYQIFGILPQDFKGSKEAFQATIHPEDRDAVVAAYARSLEDADFIYDIEHRILRKDTGEVRHVHERCTHLRDADGTVVRSCGTVQDITERKRAEEERKKLQAQLIQAQKMESIGLLAGGVAHDFNNMLGVILGYSEMALEQVPAGHPMHKALHGIQQAAQRSADLTRQLLAFARKQTIAPKRIDLNETVEGMLKMLRRLIGEDIDLIWQPGRNLHPVKMDPTQIDQILANLCVNGRDAIKDVGRVTIETSNTVFDAEYCARHADFLPGEYVLLAVSDNGCGMDRETLSHLFEPFFTTKEQGQGTGLGLASVYGAVTQNKGFINVYSEPGQGTTFKIYLPRYLARAEALPIQDPAEATPRGHETILLVEDEATILEMTMMMLERLGYIVVAAATPGEAIRLAHEHAGSIDLLMTDVIMPEMNGRELAGNLLTHYPDLKPLFMSGYTANVIAHHGVLDPGVHFIQKPFTMKDLGRKLGEALDRDS